MNIVQPKTISLSFILNSLRVNVSNFFRYLQQLNQQNYSNSQTFQPLINNINEMLTELYNITILEDEPLLEDVLNFLEQVRHLIDHANDKYNVEYTKLNNMIQHYKNNINSINNQIQTVQRSTTTIQSQRYQINTLTQLFIENEEQLQITQNIIKYLLQLHVIIDNILILIDSTVSDLLTLQNIEYDSDIEQNDFDSI